MTNFEFHIQLSLYLIGYLFAFKLFFANIERPHFESQHDYDAKPQKIMN